MTVAVITDSAASIPPELAAEWGVSVVPLHLIVGGRAVEDGELSSTDLVERRAEGITTAAPSPGEFLDAVERSGADGAVILTVASRVSGAWNAARLAAESVEIPLSVVDTETAAGAQALVVLAAAAVAAGGADRAAVERAARVAIEEVRLVAVVDGLEHLVRSGRVPGIAGWAGRMLGLHPMFEFRHGVARRLRPVASREAALTRIIGTWRRSRRRAATGDCLHVAGLHAGAEGDAEMLLKRVREQLSPDAPTTELMLEFSPVMIAHTGPGLVGLAWWWQPANSCRDPGAGRGRCIR
jgi:DegV family protein with EDD domain